MPGQHAAYILIFFLHDGCLFEQTRLFLSNISLLKHLIRELYHGGAVGHFGRDKILAIVEDQCYWSSLKRDVARVVSQSQISKGRKTNTSLYMPLPIPH